MTPLSLVEGLQYPLLARSCYSRQSVLRTVWFLCIFLFFFVLFLKLPPFCCSLKKMRTSHPTMTETRMRPTDLEPVFCFRKLCRGGKKWTDPSLNVKNAGKWTPPPPPPSTSSSQIPPLSGQISLQHKKQEKASYFFPCAIFVFGEKTGNVLYLQQALLHVSY